MVSPSKLYIDPLCRVHCSQAIMHPGEGCLIFMLRNIHRQGMSSAKYFLPLLISPLFSKWKSMDRDLFISALKFYMQTVGCATASAIFIISQICALRNVLGRYYKYTAISIPGFSGMSICWFFPQRVINLYLVATTQAAIEVMIRHRSNFFTRLICDSKTIQTLLFMVNSAFILHFKSLKFYKGFWFIKPNEIYAKTNNLSNKDVYQSKSKITNFENCSHTGQTCLGFLLGGLKSNVLIGLSLDLVSIVLRDKVPNNTNGFWNTILTKVRNLKLHRFKMTSFFLSYIGIYRLTNCLIQGVFKINSNHHWPHIASAFLGGAAYIFLDQLTIYTLSLVLTIQILWQWACSQPQEQKDDYSILGFLKRIKFAQIIVPLNISYLLHNYLYRCHLVNSLACGFINGITDSIPKQILEHMTASDTETILRAAASFSKRMAC